MFSPTRIFNVEKPDFTPEDFELLPKIHSGKYLELFYNLVMDSDNLTLPEHLRPVAVGMGDPNIEKLMVIISPGAGKALKNGTKIATPSGEFKKVEELKIGDLVCTPDGGSSTVTGVFPQGKVKLYEIVFDDLRTLITCENHLWEVYNKSWARWDKKTGQNKDIGYRIKDTKYLAGKVDSYPNKYSAKRYYIPLTAPIEYTKKELPLHPYLLGVLLGDGHINHALEFTNLDSEVIEKTNQLLADYNVTLKQYDCHVEGHYNLVAIKGQNSDGKKDATAFRDILRDLNLWGTKSETKFIPEIYKTGSLEQRLQLIKGLMDTDGYISENTTVGITLSNEKLIEDIQELIWSVGGIASIAERETGYNDPINGEYVECLQSFRLNIRHPKSEILFSCSFKKNRAKPNQYSDRLKLEITEINEIGEGEATCIRIDHNKNLFVTEQYLVTHNSQLTDVVFPAWELGLDTNTSVLAVSAAEGLMVDFLQATMNVIEHNPLYREIFPNTIPDKLTGWCVLPDTEVLTRRGWLHFQDLVEDDEVATRNQISHEFEWQKPTEFICQDYNGEIINFCSRGIDLAVTPNHRMIVTDRKFHNSEKMISAEKLSHLKQSAIPMTSKWSGTEIPDFEIIPEKPEIRDLVPEGISTTYNCTKCNCEHTNIWICNFCGSRFHRLWAFHRPHEYCSLDCKQLASRNEIRMSGDDYCAFIAMYLSKGHTGFNHIEITQNRESKGFTAYNDLITKLFGDFYLYDENKITFYIYSTFLTEHVKQFGHKAPNKLIPELIKNGTSKQIQIFLKYYKLGDDYSTITAGPNKNSRNSFYYTTSHRMADDLQELCQKAGWYASIRTIVKNKDVVIKGQTVKADNLKDIYVIREHFKKNSYDPKNYLWISKHKRFQYTGKVYCATVPNGTLYIRRNSYAAWVGNSTYRGIYVKRGEHGTSGLADPSYCVSGYKSKRIIGKHARIICADDLHDDENCYDENTEVLTRRGWLLFKDVTLNDEVATRNSNSWKFEWQHPIKLIESNYNGELINFCSRGIDICVTPNHRMIVTHRTSQGSEYIKRADELEKLSNRAIPVTSIWEGCEIPEQVFELKEENKTDYNSNTQSVHMSGDDYCAFMGMYLAKGYCYTYSKNKVVICQQAESKGFEPYTELITRIWGKVPYYNDKNGQLFINSVLIYNYLSSFGDGSLNKRVPQLIKDASTKQIEIFLYYFNLGDGSVNGSIKGRENKSYTSSKQLADDLQELYQKTGFYASILTRENNNKDKTICGKLVKAENCQDSYTIRRHFSRFDHSEKNYISVRKSKRIQYNGKVRCVSVPNGTLYVRRNGYAAWCGNSASTIMINALENWYYRNLVGRRSPLGTRFIMIGRRWVEDDAYSRLRKAGDWLVMELSAIQEGDEDPFHLYYEATIPAGLSCVFNNYIPSDKVEEIKITYAEEDKKTPHFFWPGQIEKYKESREVQRNKPDVFQTVYQSKPELSSTKIFKEEDFRFYNTPINLADGRNYADVAEFMAKMFEFVIQSWDTSLSGESSADPNCGYTLGLHPCVKDHRSEDPEAETPFHYDIYVLDELFAILDYGALHDALKEFYYKWQPNKPVILENSANGIPLISSLKSDNIETLGVIVQGTNKRSRAINGAKAGSAQGWFRQGRVLFPMGAPWTEALKTELKDFTGARKGQDNRVDALIHGINFAIDLGTNTRDLPEGWNSDEAVQQRLQEWLNLQHPFYQIAEFAKYNPNPFDGLCGTCRYFNNNFCNLHKHAVSTMHTCMMFIPANQKIMILQSRGN